MADMDSAELLHSMRELIRTIKDNSLSGGYTLNRQKTNTEKFADQKKDSSKTNEDRLRLEKAVKEGTKALKDTFKQQENYSKDMKVANGLFNNAIRNLSLKSFDELPKKISNLTADLGFQFQSTADIQKTLRQGTIENITAAKGLHTELLGLTLGTEAYNEKLRQIQKVWSQDITLLALPAEELQQNFMKLGHVVNDTTKSIDQMGKSSAAASKAGTILAEVLMYAGYQLLDATRASAKFGVEILPLAKDMKILGMSADELGEIQNKNVQAMRGAGMSFGDFDNMLISGAYQLAAYTGSMKDGAIIFGDAFRNFRMMSSATKDQNKFITDTAKVYKFMHETVGTTAQQFQELTQTLMGSNEVQVNMYRLNERQRTQAFQDLLTQDALLKTYGLLEPEARAVVQTFAQIGSQGPKERLKQAAQLQAVGGALGMGTQTAKLAALIRSGDTNSPEAVKLAREIQQKAQQQYANVKGTAGEFAQYALTNIPGVQQILGQAGPVANLGTRQGVATPPNKIEEAKNKAEGKMSKEDKARETAVTAVVTIGDQVKGIKGLLEIIAATLALPTFTGLLKKVFTGGIGKLLGRGAAGALGEGALAGEAGVAGAAGGAGLLAGGAAVVGAGAAGYAAGSLIDMVPRLFGGKDISEYAADVLEKWDPMGLNTKKPEDMMPKTVAAYDKSKQVHSLMEQYEKGDQGDKQHKDLLNQLDALTTEIAKANGKDPAGVAKAVDDLHKTIKNQHQENKEMTQEQTDAVKAKKNVVQTRSSTPVGQTS